MPEKASHSDENGTEWNACPGRCEPTRTESGFSANETYLRCLFLVAAVYARGGRHDTRASRGRGDARRVGVRDKHFWWGRENKNRNDGAPNENKIRYSTCLLSQTPPYARWHLLLIFFSSQPPGNTSFRAHTPHGTRFRSHPVFTHSERISRSKHSPFFSAKRAFGENAASSHRHASLAASDHKRQRSSSTTCFCDFLLLFLRSLWYKSTPPLQ